MKAVQSGDISGILLLTTSLSQAMDTQFEQDQAALKQNLTDGERKTLEEQAKTRSEVITFS